MSQAFPKEFDPKHLESSTSLNDIAYQLSYKVTKNAVTKTWHFYHAWKPGLKSRNFKLSFEALACLHMSFIVCFQASSWVWNFKPCSFLTSLLMAIQNPLNNTEIKYHDTFSRAWGQNLKDALAEPFWAYIFLWSLQNPGLKKSKHW